MFLKELAQRSVVAKSSTRLFSSAAAQPNRRLGPNGVVGAMIFSFVGGVYYYTVFQLRKQGGELMDELDNLEQELENESKQ
jgi:hypothetical protein